MSIEPQSAPANLPRPLDERRARLRQIITNVEADRSLAAALTAIRELAEIVDHVIGGES